MKLWERVEEARLREVVMISVQQCDFMPGKSTRDATFALRMSEEKTGGSAGGGRAEGAKIFIWSDKDRQDYDYDEYIRGTAPVGRFGDKARGWENDAK